MQQMREVQKPSMNPQSYTLPPQGEDAMRKQVGRYTSHCYASSRVALTAIAAWILLSDGTLLKSEPSPCLPHQGSTKTFSFPKSAFPRSTHSATLAQFLQDCQVELEEEAEGKCASEIHHAARSRRRQIHLTRQQAAGVLQQLLIPVSAREQSDRPCSDLNSPGQTNTSENHKIC